jgi:hypothetical protein
MWPAMIAGRIATAAEDEYFAMADAVNGIKVRTAKDVPAWAEAVRTLGEVSDARGERAVFVAVRMPTLLRLLLYVATSSLVFGMALLRFEVPAIGGVVIACTVVVSLLVLEVIDDLDDPFRGAWAMFDFPAFSEESRPSAQRGQTGVCWTGRTSAPCQELPTSQKRSIRVARSNGDIQEQRPSD